MTIYSIYKITNLINNKVYIGYTSKTSEIRFNNHIAVSSTPSYSHIKLYKAFKKYNVDNFTVNTIYQSKDKNHLVKIMEQYFIDEYNSMDDRFGYNMCVGGQGGNIKSKEILTRDSIRYSGENNPIHKTLSTEVGRENHRNKTSIGTKLGLANSEKFQIQLQNSTKIFNSDKNPGKNKTKETCKRISEALKLIVRYDYTCFFCKKSISECNYKRHLKASHKLAEDEIKKIYMDSHSNRP